MNGKYLSSLLVIAAGCCGCAVTDEGDTYDFPITRSVMGIGRYHPETFQQIDEAYQHTNELIIAYTTHDIAQDAPVEHWLRFDPDGYSDTFVMRLPSDIVEVGHPSALILKDFERIPIVINGDQLSDVHEGADGAMTVAMESDQGNFTVRRNEEGDPHNQRFIFPDIEARRAYAYPVLAIGVPVAVVADVSFCVVVLFALGISTM